MKILIISQNYPPDLGAGAFRMKSLVDSLTSMGHEIIVLTATPNRYESIDSKINPKQTKETIIRINLPKQKRDLLRRGINYWVFYKKALKAGAAVAGSVDGILATTPQLLVAYVGAVIARKHRKPLILDVRDLWPDVLLDLEITKPTSILYKTLKKIEISCYRQAKQIIVNSPSFLDPVTQLSKKGPVLITNGIDDELFEDLSKLEVKKESAKPYHIIYAGNIGIAQDLSILLSVANSFQQLFKFELVGDGSERDSLCQVIRERSINNVIISPPMKRTELLNKYRNADAFFVHLKNVEMFKKTIPSKIFEYIATGKPVVYGLNGISKQIMNELQGEVFSFRNGNVDSLIGALTSLQEALEKNLICENTKGRTILQEKYLRSRLNAEYSQILENTLNHAH